MSVSAIDLAGLLPDFSDRDISENLAPIDGSAAVRRTVNGRLVSVASPNFRKYRLSVSGSDVEAPALGQLWPGDILSIVPFSFLTHFEQRPVNGWQNVDGEISVELAREPLNGSVEISRGNGSQIATFYLTSSTVRFQASDDDFYIKYRPKMSVMVTSWTQDESEISGSVSWSLEAEEV
ncbi:hypothetical protein [Sulfitobacter sp. M22]|uniref:hypothetical protein n=1 Tax=Sulfitobacter sp. M22 TaxID=2675332 RepID=UPI001F3A35DB|nr:hypothetical protein [Sulfitobacter sp. M22]MCF7728698.1 hypothetical protein [Sulfitobacter sp. M22]